MTNSVNPTVLKNNQDNIKKGIIMSKEIDIQVSSGNIFADLGMPNADEMLMKAELVRQINQIITQRKLNQLQAAEVLGIDQPKVSALMRGKLTGFSTERLFRFLNALGCDVQIVVKPKLKSPAIPGISVVTI
ncbi:helix-turn-helix domain-containing protein [Microcoleus sp. bin38.metabat.b11b12b14.051]|uniref:helix-turn-helix domain-containing protein n=1 Tax=Microcoleus sp. bin38.metabat.b11b12b14.051 TaxID=2742709 RepID=UPI0025DE4993|nr:helix-turn-helix transcriptional regulator [Microcoleus sp. bin38.metabat.b11b12b14.051]